MEWVAGRGNRAILGRARVEPYRAVVFELGPTVEERVDWVRRFMGWDREGTSKAWECFRDTPFWNFFSEQHVAVAFQFWALAFVLEDFIEALQSSEALQ